MTDQPTDHRVEAVNWLAAAAIDEQDLPTAVVSALIGIGHALLAQDHDRAVNRNQCGWWWNGDDWTPWPTGEEFNRRCTATRGHANGHHWPTERPAATSSVD